MTDVLRGARIVFDLDGTLVDSAPDLVRAVNAVTAARNLPPISIDLVRAMVGRGARILIQRAFSHHGQDLPDDEAMALTGEFLDAYRDGIDQLSTPFPGAVAMLDSLIARGAEVSIATNKPTDLAVLLLEKLEMADRFVRILGPDSVVNKKPSGEHILIAAGHDALRDRIVMVGDSETDVAAARDAGCPVIVMTYGYTETPAHELGADRLLSACDQIIPALEDLLSRP